MHKKKAKTVVKKIKERKTKEITLITTKKRTTFIVLFYGVGITTTVW
jgi:hypothetical protein